MIVFVLVGLKLGFLASLAGVSTLLALIPVQVGFDTPSRPLHPYDPIPCQLKQHLSVAALQAHPPHPPTHPHHTPPFLQIL
jgi:hypothetical protein